MLDKDHVICSEALYLTFNTFQIQNSSLAQYLPYTSLKTYFPIAFGIFLGSQLPDIDTTSSKIGKCTRPISNLIAYFGHRGFTHSLWALLLIFILNFWLLPTEFNLNYIITTILNGIIIGYALHLIEDGFSKAGEIWFFPFPVGSYHKWKHNIYVRNHIHTKWRYKTGGKVETYIRRLSLIIIYLDLAFIIFECL